LRVIFLSLTFAAFFAPVSAWAQATHGQNPNLVRIPGGTFLMGTHSGGNDNERPVRMVTISGFYMSRHPVTQGEWFDVVGSNPSHFQGGRLAAGVNWRNLPVENVSWFDAVEFANWKSIWAGLEPAYTITGTGANRTVVWNREANGYRLPTEAEWEFAARGGDRTPGHFIFSGSDTADEVAWHQGNSGGRTHEVGRLRPNALGLYDMSGNVSEWVYDRFGPYPSAAQTNPTGPAAGVSRVARGGGWNLPPGNARSAIRRVVNPVNRYTFIGFRVVRP